MCAAVLVFRVRESRVGQDFCAPPSVVAPPCVTYGQRRVLPPAYVSGRTLEYTDTDASSDDFSVSLHGAVSEWYDSTLGSILSYLFFFPIPLLVRAGIRAAMTMYTSCRGAPWESGETAPSCTQAEFMVLMQDSDARRHWFGLERCLIL